jgi:hypothetical protein
MKPSDEFPHMLIGKLAVFEVKCDLRGCYFPKNNVFILQGALLFHLNNA